MAYLHVFQVVRLKIPDGSSKVCRFHSTCTAIECTLQCNLQSSASGQVLCKLAKNVGVTVGVGS